VVREQLQQLLAPVVHDLGYQLWELEYAARSSGGLLRLYIDVPDGPRPASEAGGAEELAQGITLEDCERVSRAVSAALDADDPIDGHYTLEVSSPGLDRVLRTREHFAHFLGERVRVEMTHLVAGRRRFLGRLTGVGEQDITLDVEGAPVRLDLTGIHKARVAPWAS
jgi:ribosome maturation factor RimP